MQVLLLLTLDPGLEREIEKAWGDGMLLTLDSPETVASTLQTLDGRPLLLVDTTCFSPPAKLEVDLLCVGEEVTPGYPLLERPIRPNELRALASARSPDSSSVRSGLNGILPSPFAEFQRDTIHDLNNHFTTLQGNLMLLREEMKDPALDDMSDAAAKALKRIQWLEWLGEGEFAPERMDLQLLMEDLIPLFFRLRNRKTAFTLCPPDSPLPALVGDPQKTLALLLVLIHHIPGEPETCTLHLNRTGRTPEVRCTWPETPEEFILPEIVTTWMSALRVEGNTSPTSWSLQW